MMLEIKFKVQIIEVSAGVARLADAADATFLGYDQPPSDPQMHVRLHFKVHSPPLGEHLNGLSSLMHEFCPNSRMC